MPSLSQVVDGTYKPLALELVEMLIDAAAKAAAEATAARAAAVRRRQRPPGRGLTLRPGPDTPLWRELVRQVRPHLRKYGAKAQLARLLGLPRQRLQDCLKAGSASLDAERTLLLLGWRGFFQRGGELIPVVRPGRPRRKAGVPPVPGNV
ncbi:MAG: hypothetical protein PSV13_17355 [Lacunisphaera sp.]|nr:hypothetical protein [Lacunisphaera sp.]